MLLWIISKLFHQWKRTWKGWFPLTMSSCVITTTASKAVLCRDISLYFKVSKVLSQYAKLLESPVNSLLTSMSIRLLALRIQTTEKKKKKTTIILRVSLERNLCLLKWKDQIDERHENKVEQEEDIHLNVWRQHEISCQRARWAYCWACLFSFRFW